MLACSTLSLASMSIPRCSCSQEATFPHNEILRGCVPEGCSYAVGEEEFMKTPASLIITFSRNQIRGSGNEFLDVVIVPGLA